MRTFVVMSMLIFASSAMGSITNDMMDIDEILGRGLLASGSGSGSAAALPSGTVKYTVTLSFSGSAPTGSALDTFKTTLASSMATTLFGGKVAASDITITVSSGRRRLLAFSVRVLVNKVRHL